MKDFFNHHSVDQFPQLDELPAWDQALDSFRMLFPLYPTAAHVAEDGKSMQYRLRGTKLMDNYLKMARLVIRTHQLPLEASNDGFAIGDVVFEDNLVITYVGKQR